MAIPQDVNNRAQNGNDADKTHHQVQKVANTIQQPVLEKLIKDLCSGDPAKMK
jgi:hypothetical protein